MRTILNECCDNALRACVVFDTRYGNTEKIAKSIETGLKEAGVQTLCVNAKDVAVDSLKQYDLICVGAPTEAFSAVQADENIPWKAQEH